MSPDDRILAYLSDDLDPAQRECFETDLAQDPALRAELEQWQALAGARQLIHNEHGRAARDSAFLEMISTQVAHGARSAALQETAHPQVDGHEDTHAAGLVHAYGREQQSQTPPAPSLTQRIRRWIWPTPVSPLMPAGWALALLMSVVLLQSDDDRTSPGTLTRGGTADCPALLLDLPDDVSAKQLRDALVQYEVGIVHGPDTNGRFLMSAKRESSLQGVAKALGVTSAGTVTSTTCPYASP